MFGFHALKFDYHWVEANERRGTYLSVPIGEAWAQREEKIE